MQVSFILKDTAIICGIQTISIIIDTYGDVLARRAYNQFAYASTAIVMITATFLILVNLLGHREAALVAVLVSPALLFFIALTFVKMVVIIAPLITRLVFQRWRL